LPATALFPAIITPDELARFHGIDERISIENLGSVQKAGFAPLSSQ